MPPARFRQTPTPAQTPPSPAATAAARDLVELFRRLRRRMRQVSGAGLTPSQASVLIRLRKDGASTTTVLATAEGVRSQSMTATLGALEQQGLIVRSPDPEDGRRYIITPSAAGRRLAEEDRDSRHAWLIRALDEHLTAEQLGTVHQALALLAEILDREE
jgi:DNA-binding MarR family transcriptional regulator